MIGRTVAAAVVAALAVAACSPPHAGPADPRPPSAAAPDAEPGTPDPASPTSPAVPSDPEPVPVSPSVPSPRVAEPVEPTFEAAVSSITAELTERMVSWRPGCPAPLEDLRYVTVSHRTFDDDVETGELVVHADVADGVVEVFRTLFEIGYPIASMRLVDDFGADDDASMAANNTSAFNCRAMTGGSGWSEHSYGRAIDLNPVQNPYVRGATVLPPEGAPYVSRPDEPGVLRSGDAVVKAFAAAGWSWGGHWNRPIDYQHFSTTGR